MPIEPPSEQIVQKMVAILKAALRPVSTNQIWYRPDLIMPVDIMEKSVIEGSGVNHLVTLSPGDEFELEKTAGNIAHMMEVFVFCAMKWTVGEVDPKRNKGDTRWTLQNRMAWDVVNTFAKDVTLKGSDNLPLAYNTEIREIRRNFDQPERWAVVGLLYEVQFDSHPT